ncbi:MAG: hypothetical protein HY898_18925 [Deltaproteobacteria bacterium]|nr:hypothetical protein [Deltaproteobacteria bacterium]
MIAGRIAVASSLLALAGCGSGDDGSLPDASGVSDAQGASDAPGPSDASTEAPPLSSCETLQPSANPTWVDSFFGVAIYTALKNTGDPSYEDAVGIRLRTGYGYLDNIPPYDQVPGTFDLGDPLENDYRTCRHCVFALVDVSGDHIQHLYLAVAGTLTLTSVNIDTGEAVGTVSSAVLQEIEATGYYEWAGPMAGGPCRSIPQLAFDTRAVPGGKCVTAEDCPNAQLLSCEAGTCVK